MQWFYAQGGQQIGPSEDGAFDALIQAGVIRADTLVWRQGMANWEPLAVVRGYPNGGYPNVAYPNAAYAAPQTGVHFGGFWIRFLARAIDGFILSIPTIILVVPLMILLGVASRPSRLMPFGPAALMMQGVLMLISVSVGAAYEVYFLSTRGATPGKMALGLKVVRHNGAPLTAALSFGRYLSHLLSGYILLIGYLMAAFDSEKRALHDRICDTRVIYAR